MDVYIWKRQSTLSLLGKGAVTTVTTMYRSATTVLIALGRGESHTMFSMHWFMCGGPPQHQYWSVHIDIFVKSLILTLKLRAAAWWSLWTMWWQRPETSTGDGITIQENIRLDQADQVEHWHCRSKKVPQVTYLEDEFWRAGSYLFDIHTSLGTSNHNRTITWAVHENGKVGLPANVQGLGNHHLHVAEQERRGWWRLMFISNSNSTVTLTKEGL